MRYLLAALFLLPLNAFADALTTAQVEITWPAPGFTITGLNVTEIDFGTQGEKGDLSFTLSLTASASAPATKDLKFATQSASRSFWLHATGTGSVSMSIPYSMSVTCQAADDAGLSNADGYIRIWATLGGGQVYEDYAVCGESKSGVIELSRTLTNPSSRLIPVHISAFTQVLAEVPESPWLLVVGLSVASASAAIRRRLHPRP